MIVYTVSKYKPIIWTYQAAAINLSVQELKSLHIHKSLEHLTNLMICRSRNRHNTVYHPGTNDINGCFEILKVQMCVSEE